ncbi:MAG TPA: exodeoxyribonuclease III [Planctomycetota bacterium]|nr:exodeoxyribonuclease III [Planctomycetota bacterium]
MRIATWNVNSLRRRLERVVAWLGRRKPDVVCLQETKCEDLVFPRRELEDLGYRCEIHGQKTYNGVAVLSKAGCADVVRGLPDDPPDAQCRALAATTGGVRVLDLYVPNGGDVGTDKYAFKLEWMARLRAYLDARFDPNAPLVVCGDFNVAPEDRDVYDPEKLRGTILCSEPEREALRRVAAFGLVDAFRLFHQQAGAYTWWDYRAAMFRRGLGLRIDHLLLSAPMAKRCVGVEIDVEERRGEGPSDHAPVIAEFAEA